MVDMPGISSLGGFLPGDDPALSPSVAAGVARQVWEQTQNALREQAMVSGDFTTQMRENIKRIGDMSRDLDVARNTIRQDVVTARGAPSPTDPSGGYSEASAGTRGAVPAPEIAPAGPFSEGQIRGAVPADSGGGMTFSEGRKVGGSLGMRDVTQKAANALQRKVGSGGTTWMVDEHTDTATEYDRDNNVVNRIYDYSQNPEGQEQVAQGNKAFERRELVAGALGRYAAGKGITGALGGSVLRVAGPVGVAVGVADQAFRQVADQTEAGADYRRVYGEDAGRFAMSQRLDRRMAGVGGYFSGVGSERAGQGYDAMMGLGFSGQRLDDAVAFDERMYLSSGMTAQESSRVAELGRDTNTSLEELAGSLERVGAAAVSAGRNANEAQQRFTGMAESLAGRVTSSSGAVYAAEEITTDMAQRLPSYLNNDATAQALSGAANEQNVMMHAFRTGQDWRQVSTRAALGLDDTIQQVVGGSMAEAVDTILRTAGTSRKQVQARIKQVAPELRSGQSMTPEQMASVLGAFPNIYPELITSVFSFHGLAFDAGSAIPMFFEEIGGFSEGLQTNSEQEEGQGLSGSIKRIAEQFGADTTDHPVGEGDFRDLVGEEDLGPGVEQVGKFGRNLVAFSDDPFFGQDFGGGSATASRYQSLASRTGDRNYAIEGLLDKEARKTIEEFSGKDLDDTKFETSKGKKSLSEIINDPALLSDLSSIQVSPSADRKNDPAKTLSELSGYDTATGSRQSSSSAASGGSGDNGWFLQLTPLAQQIFELSGPTADQRRGNPDAATVSPERFGR